MRFCLAILMFLTGTTLRIAAEEPVQSWEQMVQKIDAVVPSLMERHHTPGVSIAIVEESRIVWTRGYGRCDAGSSEPVTPETVFEACSMSKPVYTYAVMTLVENGQLDLDRPLVEYLEQPYLDDEQLHRKITARMVLNHTSGFPNWRPGGWRSGSKLVVNFEPGTKFGYSGEGFTFLQHVVEKIVGEPTEEWMQRMVLQPLGMKRSSFIWRPEYEQLASSGHDANGELKSPRRHYSRANSAYSLYTTPAEYALFQIEMMTANGSSSHSLRAETVESMLTRQPIRSTRNNDARGLGWALPASRVETYAYHGGANGTGFRCYNRFDRSTGSGIVIMTNAISGTKVQEGIVAELFPKKN